MARESKVSPTLTTNTSSNDDDNDDDNDNDNEYNNLLREMGLVYASLCGNKEARASLEHSMENMNGYKETIGELESYIENSRMRFNLLKQELSDEKHNTFLLTQKIESYEVEKEKYINDACATNSTFCEASTSKEIVELKAYLELLTSKFRELEESYEKLSSSHKSTLISYEELKLAHELSITKVTSCEPHVEIITMSCASPSDSSRHNIATSCDELVDLPCCSNNKASTSSSTCITTNLVEEIKELKAQVTSLEKDLEKCQEGNSTLNDMPSVPRFPKDKSGLGFNSNDRNKSKVNNKKGQDKVKNSANIICFKCKVKGHHVRDCP
jgi:chromosome segregation ATPase